MSEVNASDFSIIIIEDDNQLNYLLQKKIKSYGYKTIAICNPKDAIDIINVNLNSILIIDYNLPNTNAKEFVIMLAERNIHLPFIVITGSGDVEKSVEMMKLGAHDYLVKDLNFLNRLPELVNKMVIDLITRRRLVEAEMALHESEEQTAIFKSFADASGQGLSMASMDGNIVYMNPAMKEMLNIDDFKFEKISIEKLYPEHYSFKIKHEVLPKLRRGKQWTEEVKLIARDGRLIPVIQNLFLIKDDNGNPLYIATVVADISERIAAEELMNLQSIMLESTANSIVITNTRGEIIWVNSAFTELTGYNKEEVLYKSISILNSGTHEREFFSHLWSVIKSGKVWRGEMTNKRKNGRFYIEEQTITPVYNKENVISNFISIKQDITERKKIEDKIQKLNEELEQRVIERTSELRVSNKALKESETKFRTLFESASDSVVLMHGTDIFDCNPVSIKMFGVESKNEFINQCIFDFMPETQPETGNSLDLFLGYIKKASGLDFLRFESVFAKKNGNKFFADVTLSTIMLGKIEFTQLVIRDITTKKENEAALREAQAQLIESEKMAALGELVAGVAHEINTPVGISVTAASYLDEKAKEIKKLYETALMKKSDLESFVEMAVNATNSILSNLKRAADLVRSFKQVAIDQTSSEIRKFNLKEYIDEILFSLRPKLKRTNHIVLVHCSNDIEIRSCPGSFAQIITNFIMNSLIHGFDDTSNGVITINIEEKRKYLYLEYIDNGIGISKEFQKKIFEPFFTSKRGKGGSGLGLHIVYNIVTKKLGGTIYCESEVNCGVKFIIKIPIQFDDNILQEKVNQISNRN